MPEPEPTPSAAAATTPRAPLSRDRVLQAALALADEGGVEALSMRRLGQALGVEAMSLYKHVADKEAILDGIADLVTEEMGSPRRTSPGARPSAGARSRPTRRSAATPGRAPSWSRG